MPPQRIDTTPAAPPLGDAPRIEIIEDPELVEVELSPDGTINVPSDNAPPAPPPDSAEAGMEALRKQLKDSEERERRAVEAREAERTARLAAERRAGESVATSTVAERGRLEAQATAIVQALTSVDAELKTAKSAYAKLMSDGEFEKAAELGEQIGVLGARKHQLTESKSAYEVELKKPVPEPRPAATEDQQQEQWLNQQADYNARWIRQHRDRFFDPRDMGFQKKAIAASAYATDVLGLRGGSDEYFKHIEETVGLRQRETPPAPPAPPQTPASAAHSAAASPQPAVPPQSPTPRTAAAAAPPSRSAPPTHANGGDDNVVRLTKEQAEFCRLNDIDPVAYARQQKKLRQEGLIGTGR